MPEPYLTIREPIEHEIEVRRSRFICALAPVRTEEEAREFIAGRRKAHYAARHTCSAYLIGRRLQKADDDGEPSGTAGAPMLEVLTRRGFGDIVAAVTRYFGGVLLGTGGLARAYGGAVAEALDRAQVVRMVPARLMVVRVGHAQAGRLENDLRASPHTVREVVYGSDVRLEVGVDPGRTDEFAAWIAALTAGQAVVEAGPLVHVPA